MRIEIPIYTYFFKIERKVFNLEESSGDFSGASDAVAGDIARSGF